MKELDSIFQEHAEAVFKYIYCLCKNYSLAEELTQETFYQAVKSIGRYNGRCKMSVWLCQIAKHSYYKYLEKHKNEMLSDLWEFEDTCGKADTEETVINNCNRISAYKEIHLLDEPYREVFLLRALGDLSFKDIGDILDKNENWARVTYYRAKVKIKERSMIDENEV